MLVTDLDEVHITQLEGLGSSYRMKGFFTLKIRDGIIKINFTGVAFGGNFGGHNVNVQISSAARRKITAAEQCTSSEIEDIMTEVQRRLLNNEMIVEFDKIKPNPEQEFTN